MFYHNDKLSVPFVSVIITGPPKVGKTRLAGQFTKPMFLDVDDGAGHTGAPRITFEHSPSGFSAYNNVLAEVARLRPGEDGYLHYKSQYTNSQEVVVGTIVLDSVSEWQNIAGLGIKAPEPAKSTPQKGKRPISKFEYYGQIKTLLRQPLADMRSIWANRVYVVHSQERAEDEYGEITRLGMAIEGSQRDILPAHADLILTVWHDALKGSTVVVTKERRIGNTIVSAGDRYNLFGGETVPLYQDGDINPEIVRVIESITTRKQVEMAPWESWKTWGDITTWVSEGGRPAEGLADFLKEKVPGPFNIEKAKAYWQALEDYGKQ